MAKEEEDILKRPVYVYDIPPDLLESLTLRTDQPTTPDETQPSSTSITTVPQDPDISSTSCALCKITNKTVADQRAHVRSDLHHFNLKRKLRGQPPVAEAEFDDLLEGLNESISGSDSSSPSDDEDDNSGPTDQLSALLKRNAILSHPNDEPATAATVTGWKQGAGKAPIIWFNSPLLPAESSLGVYRAIFTTAEQSEASWLSALRSKQLSVQPKGREPHIFMCMIGGGHFAAMVVSLAPKVSKVGGGERSAAIIAHKTFHRYTTRRKQGGAQSASDAAKGAAHSAGSSLRRYNEVALTAEIRELLGGWKDWLDSAELLYVRAVGNSNRRTLFGEGAPLKSNDPRVRGFPFSTRRATQSELMRCFVELTRSKLSTLTTASLATLSSTTTPPPASTSKPKPAPPKLTPAEETAQMHSTQLTALIRRSKAPALLTYLSTHSLPTTFTFTPPNHHTPTLLHFAAASSSPAVVSALLLKARADPTLTTPTQPHPAFVLCGDRATRDAFRVARHELGDSAWDWEAAGVPAALTRAEAEERERREKGDGEKGEKERREREVRRLKEEEAKAAAESRRLPGRGGRNLGGVQMAMGKREEEERGLGADARMKLERERRARAAEERIKRMTR